jgi:hypothetical protein
MTDDELATPPFIPALERALSVAVIVQEVEPGPPAAIVATGMVDADVTSFTASGATLDEAWRDLASQVAAWRNVDGRTIRMMLGGF